MINARSVAVLIVTVLSLAHASTAGVPSTTTNLELASNIAGSNPSPAVLGDGFVIFPVGELEQGGTPLNGDGDTDEDSLHVYDTATGTTTNLMLTSTVASGAADGSHVFFTVQEFRQGVDLNSDGVISGLDQVLHLYDHATGTVTNIGLDATPPVLRDGLAAWPTSEQDQGFTDLNGDSDTFDRVLHVYDTATGVTTNVGVDQQGPIDTADQLVAFIAREANQANTDLNSDGDMSDNVVHIYEHGVGVTNLGFAVHLNGLVTDDGYVAFRVDESAHGAGGTDLNGDSDIDDDVVHVFDLSTGVTTNLGLQSTTLSLAQVGSVTSFLVDEAAQGANLNGDGDMTDDVLHFYDPNNGGITNTGLAVQHVRRNGRDSYFDVFEHWQGGTDLNGDLDTADLVLHHYDSTTQVVTNLMLRADTLQNGSAFHGRRFAWEVDEAGQGATDLNGDSDTSDKVLHVYDPETAVATNLAIATHRYFHGNNRLIGVSVIEAAQNNSDLNADSDTGDYVAHVVDLDDYSVTNLGIAAHRNDGAPKQFTRESVIATAVSEIDHAATDLNNDTDTDDVVFHVTAPPPTDYGDAPDPGYPVLLASDGARHVIAGGLFLGASVDNDPDGQPSSDASGDDNDAAGDDEDGVSFTSLLLADQSANVDVESSAAGLLDAWIDFDGNGDWNGSGEQIFSDEPLIAGTNALSFSVPAGATAPLDTYARFRVSTAGGLSPTGLALDGEVEDHAVYITGDADLEVSINASPTTVVEGESLTYTVTVTNNGPEVAADVMLTDSLDGLVSFVSVDPAGPTCSETAGVVTCDFGSLAALTSAVATIEVTVDGGIAPAILTNSASVAGSLPDSVAANNAATLETDVVLPADVIFRDGFESGNTSAWSSP